MQEGVLSSVGQRFQRSEGQHILFFRFHTEQTHVPCARFFELQLDVARSDVYSDICLNKLRARIMQSVGNYVHPRLRSFVFRGTGARSSCIEDVLYIGSYSRSTETQAN